MRKTLMVLMAVALLATAAYAAIKCPLCKMSMYYTGNDKFEWGKRLSEYECANGHTYWLVR